MVMGMANLAMAHRQHRARGRRRQPAARAEQRAGLVRHGVVPARAARLPARVAARGARDLRVAVGRRRSRPSRGCASRTCSTPRSAGRSGALYVQGEDIAQSDPNTQHVEAALRSMDLVVVQDLFLNETAKFAHVFLPGTSFLEKDGTFTNAERRINRVRPVMPSRVGKDEWEVACEIATAMGYDDVATTTPSRDHGRDRRHHADVRRRLVRPARRGRLDAVAGAPTPPRTARRSCTSASFVRGHGPAHRRRSTCRPTERANRQLPADPHHRPDPVAVQRRRADPAHAELDLAPRGRPRDPPRRRRAARHHVGRRRRAVQSRVGHDHAHARWCPSGCRPASSTRPSTTR